MDVLYIYKYINIYTRSYESKWKRLIKLSSHRSIKKSKISPWRAHKLYSFTALYSYIVLDKNYQAIENACKIMLCLPLPRKKKSKGIRRVE